MLNARIAEAVSTSASMSWTLAPNAFLSLRMLVSSAAAWTFGLVGTETMARLPAWRCSLGHSYGVALLGRRVSKGTAWTVGSD